LPTKLAILTPFRLAARKTILRGIVGVMAMSVHTEASMHKKIIHPFFLRKVKVAMQERQVSPDDDAVSILEVETQGPKIQQRRRKVLGKRSSLCGQARNRQRKLHGI
jgi:hypothetical protein